MCLSHWTLVSSEDIPICFINNNYFFLCKLDIFAMERWIFLISNFFLIKVHFAPVKSIFQCLHPCCSWVMSFLLNPVFFLLDPNAFCWLNGWILVLVRSQFLIVNPPESFSFSTSALLQSNVAMTNPLFLMILTYLKYLNEGFSGTTSDNNGRKTSGFPTALIFSEGNCC